MFSVPFPIWTKIRPSQDTIAITASLISAFVIASNNLNQDDKVETSLVTRFLDDNPPTDTSKTFAHLCDYFKVNVILVHQNYKESKVNFKLRPEVVDFSHKKYIVIFVHSPTAYKLTNYQFRDDHTYTAMYRCDIKSSCFEVDDVFDFIQRRVHRPYSVGFFLRIIDDAKYMTEIKNMRIKLEGAYGREPHLKELKEQPLEVSPNNIHHEIAIAWYMMLIISKRKKELPGIFSILTPRTYEKFYNNMKIYCKNVTQYHKGKDFVRSEYNTRYRKSRILEIDEEDEESQMEIDLANVDFYKRKMKNSRDECSALLENLIAQATGAPQYSAETIKTLISIEDAKVAREREEAVLAQIANSDDNICFEFLQSYYSINPGNPVRSIMEFAIYFASKVQRADVRTYVGKLASKIVQNWSLPGRPAYKLVSREIYKILKSLWIAGEYYGNQIAHRSTIRPFSAPISRKIVRYENTPNTTVTEMTPVTNLDASQFVFKSPNTSLPLYVYVRLGADRNLDVIYKLQLVGYKRDWTILSSEHFRPFDWTIPNWIRSALIYDEILELNLPQTKPLIDFTITLEGQVCYAIKASPQIRNLRTVMIQWSENRSARLDKRPNSADDKSNVDLLDLIRARLSLDLAKYTRIFLIKQEKIDVAAEEMDAAIDQAIDQKELADVEIVDDYDDIDSDDNDSDDNDNDDNDDNDNDVEERFSLLNLTILYFAHHSQILDDNARAEWEEIIQKYPKLGRFVFSGKSKVNLELAQKDMSLTFETIVGQPFSKPGNIKWYHRIIKAYLQTYNLLFAKINHRDNNEIDLEYYQITFATLRQQLIKCNTTDEDPLVHRRPVGKIFAEAAKKRKNRKYIPALDPVEINPPTAKQDNDSDNNDNNDNSDGWIETDDDGADWDESESEPEPDTESESDGDYLPNPQPTTRDKKKRVSKKIKLSPITIDKPEERTRLNRTDIDPILSKLIFKRNLFLYHDTGTGKTIKALMCANRICSWLGEKKINIICVTKRSNYGSFYSDLQKFQRFLPELVKDNRKISLLNHDDFVLWKPDSVPFIVLIDEVHNYHRVGPITNTLNFEKESRVIQAINNCAKAVQAILMTATPIEYNFADFSIYFMMLHKMPYSDKVFGNVAQRFKSIYQKVDESQAMDSSAFHPGSPDYVYTQEELAKCLRCYISRVQRTQDGHATHNDPIRGESLEFVSMTTGEQQYYETALEQEKAFNHQTRAACNTTSKLDKVNDLLQEHIEEIRLSRSNHKSAYKVILFSRYKAEGSDRIYEHLRHKDSPFKDQVVLLTTEHEQNRPLIEAFNDIQSNIKIAVLTLAAVEGLNLLNVSLMIMFEVPETMVKYTQVIGRVARKNGHQALDEKDRKADVILLASIRLEEEEYERRRHDKDFEKMILDEYSTQNIVEFSKVQSRTFQTSIFSEMCAAISDSWIKGSYICDNLSPCVDFNAEKVKKPRRKKATGTANK